MSTRRNSLFRRCLSKVLFLGAAAGLGLAHAGDLKISEGEAKKAAITRPAPEYPPTARQLKITGVVNVEVSINPEGDVADVRIVNGNPVLTRVVVDTVRRWKFHPFTSDEKPVVAVASLSFDFSRL